MVSSKDWMDRSNALAKASMSGTCAAGALHRHDANVASALVAFATAQALLNIFNERVPSKKMGQRARKGFAFMAALSAFQKQFELPEFVREFLDLDFSGRHHDCTYIQS